ncbi:unnamed protein product [Phytophthora fragariaefolia]|uniref:Unnamed protein product n=1 Tax=Phytophthora fragariaefolia TaxID=1490495 RepID=A0A9W6UCW3_9STRA|nr:unnamed protein product [Phytophthora fragariaefolia]
MKSIGISHRIFNSILFIWQKATGTDGDGRKRLRATVWNGCGDGEGRVEERLQSVACGGGDGAVEAAAGENSASDCGGGEDISNVGLTSVASGDSDENTIGKRLTVLGHGAWTSRREQVPTETQSYTSNGSRTIPRTYRASTAPTISAAEESATLNAVENETIAAGPMLPGIIVPGMSSSAGGAHRTSSARPPLIPGHYVDTMHLCAAEEDDTAQVEDDIDDMEECMEMFDPPMELPTSISEVEAIKIMSVDSQAHTEEPAGLY